MFFLCTCQGVCTRELQGEEGIGSLGLELQSVLKHSKRVLQTELRSSGVGSALDCSDTSLAPTDDRVAEVLVLSACAHQYSTASGSAAGGGAFV